ncbi:3-oxoadipate enol-lactonase [Pseudonocardia eucalypti]|uniref:3-oxoadipate enol-lactonase n=1 Tax=Pseudonocardia eucalypti TaxID=648755 RepID=A0ABP9RBI2_9PSEU|nr:pimeloyl-ACP methyl ester carboxylesterase [Pseudonocardia eucalypti]
MPFFTNDGNRIYYEDTGGGPVVVFSHGAFLDHTIWSPVVDRLSADHRCLTWDERGHGMSESNGPFSYWDAARDVIALLDAAGVDRAVLVGMSQGGWLSQRAALAAPDRVSGLLLTGTSMRLLGEVEQAGYAQLAAGWLAEGPVGAVADAVLDIQFAPTDYDGRYFTDRWRAKPPEQWGDVWETILGRDDITDRFTEIACPALLVHGTTDAAFPLSIAEEMSSLLPASRGVVAVPGGSHCLSLTHPDALAEPLRKFVASLEETP